MNLSGIKDSVTEFIRFIENIRNGQNHPVHAWHRIEMAVGLEGMGGPEHPERFDHLGFKPADYVHFRDIAGFFLRQKNN
ncbi:MAG: hypothetical protein GC137_03615 [Alphaproteobacteria bacterium]|nr:hypothetical protein [Alphaproteobacteria bacterium]